MSLDLRLDDEDQQVVIHESNYFSSIRTRNLLESDCIYENWGPIPSGYKALKMDYDKLIGKPFYTARNTWSTTDTRFAGSSFNIPSGLLTSALARIPFDSSTMYRAKISVVLQSSGTTMHQGTMLAGVLPGFSASTGEYSINSLMCAPHAFVSPCTNTAVKIKVPFYVAGPLIFSDSSKDVVHAGTPGADYATLILMILNPLQAGSGSTSVSISIYTIFEEIEFYAPHYSPDWVAQGFLSNLGNAVTNGADGLAKLGKTFTGDIIDSLRKGFRSLTGLHNPNQAFENMRVLSTQRNNNNIVDAQTNFEKLDPFSQFNRIADYPVFNTLVDEMDMSHILQKPQYIGFIKVETDDKVGDLKWARPIGPFQQLLKESTLVEDGIKDRPLKSWTAVNQTLAAMAKYWRGSIKIHIQSNMTGLHFARLAIARNYAPSTKARNNFPGMISMANLPFEIVEFSSAGQIHTIDLPYLSPMDRLPTITNSPQSQGEYQGAYYIFVETPVSASGTTATSIEFNIYMSFGEDFQLYGYSDTPLRHIYPYPATIQEGEFLAESEVISSPVENPVLTDSPEAATTVSIGDVRPIFSIRDWIRRPIEVYRDFVTKDELVADRMLYYDIAELVGQRGPAYKPSKKKIFVTKPASRRGTDLSVLARMFLGSTGGVKLKVTIVGSNACKLWYLPPKYVTVKEEILTTADSTSTTNKWVGLKPQIVRNVDTGDVTKQIGQYAGTNHDMMITGINSPLVYKVDAVDSYGYDERTGSMTVGSDLPTYHNNDSATTLTNMGTDTMRATICSFDIAIPNVSPYRWIGDTTKFCGAGDPSAMTSGQSNMGHLCLSVGRVSTTSESAYTIIISAAYDDVTRFGYQVNAPVVTFDPVYNTNAVSTATMQSPYCTPSYSGSNAVTNDCKFVDINPSYYKFWSP
jgi:hypothetical protein